MEENKNEKIYKIIMLTAITITATFLITVTAMYKFFLKTSKGQKILLENLQISEECNEISTNLEILKTFLENYYIGDLDLDNMSELAMKGFVEGIGDKYTEYLTKDEYEDIMISVNGDFVGIGIYMSQNSDGEIIILSPIEGSPAEEVGLQPKDIIVSINGESTDELDTSEAASKIKGEENTTVDLEIKRNGEIIKYTVERRKVDIKDSDSEILDGNIGYITLSTFDSGAAENVSKYLQAFESQGIKSAIIDLRNNTGGMVTEAIAFAKLFIKKDNIIMKSYDKTNTETIVKSDSNDVTDMEIVLLVNQYSASASEIVTAALKDNNAATIVGTTTFGKGVMQEIIPIFEGALKVTIEEFRTPNGEKIHEVGITPDVLVEDDKTTEEDEQLQKAIEILK